MSNNIFITEKLKHIYNRENKKGKNLEELFFHDVKELSHKIKTKRQDIYYLRRNKETVLDFDLELTKKHDELKSLKVARHQLIEANLNRISEEISSKGFSLKLVAGPTISDKPTYKLFSSPVSYFAEKLVQYNIATAYNIHISDRDSIISSLISILDDSIPKIIIRTDISSFFESIPHHLLIKKLDSYSNLNITTRKIIRTILKYYASNTLNEKGIPRGIGISSYLSEMFMQDIDESISNMENVIYYRRYVDDIIAIFSPPIKIDGTALLDEIIRVIKAHKLCINNDKTTIISTYEKDNFQLDYLGYTFKYSRQKPLEVNITNKRLERIKSRIDMSIAKYKKRKTPSTMRNLINQIRFLTGNTKLKNSKGRTFVGIYHTNKHITSHKNILALDSYLSHMINSNFTTQPSLQRRLLKFSFLDGFQNKSFRYFTTKQLSTISRDWKK